MSVALLDAPVIQAKYITDSWRQYVIIGLNADDISERLGLKPNIEDDPDKVESCWGFTIDGADCSVWDYKGSHRFGQYSAFGPLDKLRAVFGHNNVS